MHDFKPQNERFLQEGEKFRGLSGQALPCLCTMQMMTKQQEDFLPHKNSKKVLVRKIFQ